MNALFKPMFRKFVKKQDRAFQLAIEDEVFEVLKTPRSGEKKRGDLAGLRVHKFKFHGQEYLMAYTIEARDIVFYMIGTHENFYRELKSYLKEVD
jgi:mRNA-degrading endonuclease RelE of RelBE toxin-antitoxin system